MCLLGGPFTVGGGYACMPKFCHCEGPRGSTFAEIVALAVPGEGIGFRNGVRQRKGWTMLSSTYPDW